MGICYKFIAKYKDLKLGNGGSWCRKESTLAKKYLLEFDKTKTSGNSIDAIRTVGINNEDSFKQAIRRDIKDFYKNKPCVMLGLVGRSENTKIEIDHKDGQKNDPRVSDSSTIKMQRFEDFQPLTKAANDAKRQLCKKCQETNISWDARKLKGNPISRIVGDLKSCVFCDIFAGTGIVGRYFKKKAKKIIALSLIVTI